MSLINKVGSIMVYVNNQDAAVEFWTEKVGFQVIAEEKNGPMRWIEVAPSKDAATTITLHDKEFIAKMQPELNLGTPSLMFTTDDLDGLYANMTNKNVKVGELVSMGNMRVFNFADGEDNYFAVMEKAKA